MKIKEKITMIEAIALNCSMVTHVEPMARIFIAKDILGMPIFENFEDDKDMFEIYDELELENINSITEVVGEKEYEKLLDLAYKRYDEINNPINNMKIDEKTIEYLKGIGENLGKGNK